MAGKCPVNLQFSTFGKIRDETDPLIYLEKHNDFLVLHPLTDIEVMATMRNVLHETARFGQESQSSDGKPSLRQSQHN